MDATTYRCYKKRDCPRLQHQQAILVSSRCCELERLCAKFVISGAGGGHTRSLLALGSIGAEDSHFRLVDLSRVLLIR